MKNDVYRYVKNCATCQKVNKQVVKYAKLHFSVPSMPMEFISMDLIGEFNLPSKGGYRYALTVICMLTGYVFCIPIKTKNASEVLAAYIKNVYAIFGGSRKILSDNGTEFKNELFEKIAKELGVEHKIYTPPYHPQSNGRIEGFHYFLKACMSKHISAQLSWDEVVHLACAAYNYFPNEHSKESPFFLMFGRDPLVPLNSLIEPKVRYMGNEENMISLDTMKKIYQVVATNLKQARERRDIPKAVEVPPHVKPNDTVLIRDHVAGQLQPRFKGDYRVISLKGNQAEVRHMLTGKEQYVHLTDIKPALPVDLIIDKLPNMATFGRQRKLRIDPSRIPDLNWSLATTTNTKFSIVTVQSTTKGPEQPTISTKVVMSS